jgi:hypothetical protein
MSHGFNYYHVQMLNSFDYHCFAHGINIRQSYCVAYSVSEDYIE